MTTNILTVDMLTIAEKATLDVLKTAANMTEAQALTAISLQREAVTKAVADATAKKPAAKAEKTVVLNEIQHGLLKDIVARCKVYTDAQGTPCDEKIKDKTGKLINNPACTQYSVDVFDIGNMNNFGDIESKIADIVSWFKPNASKTGKACTTPAAEAASIIREMYISAVAEMYDRLPADAVQFDAPVDAPIDAPAAPVDAPIDAPADVKAVA